LSILSPELIQVTPSTRIGFFKEEGPAKLSNIAIEIT
jgi:hypothetical protein